MFDIHLTSLLIVFETRRLDNYLLVSYNEIIHVTVGITIASDSRAVSLLLALELLMCIADHSAVARGA